MVYPNLWGLPWWKAVFQPVICNHTFLDGLCDSFGEETILDDDCIRKYDDDKSYRINPEQEQCTSCHEFPGSGQ